MEEQIIRHCAPTLAGLKAGSMFSMPGQPGESLHCCQQALKPKGICMEFLRVSQNRSLVYLYRPAGLFRDWQAPGVKDFLEGYGYDLSAGMQTQIDHLKARIKQSSCFPHEIGLFLGYPLKDVQGFIRHRGKNFIYCGCWKVYESCAEERRLFEQFEKCRRIYLRRHMEGFSITRLTVAG